MGYPLTVTLALCFKHHECTFPFCVVSAENMSFNKLCLFLFLTRFIGDPLMFSLKIQGGYPLTVMVFYKLTIHGYIFGETGRAHHRLLWKEFIKLRPRGTTVCNWCIQCFSFESLCLPAVSERGFALMKSRTVISKLDNLSESLGVQVMKCLATVVSLPEEMSLK